MAQLGRLEFTIQDAAGNAVSGASVEVRRQGAQVFGAHAGAQTTFNVDSPGAVVAADTVAINTGTVTRTVSSITATTVVVGGAGFNNAADDDRITIVSALPTVYEDAESATSKTNPLTTDANGYANCFVVGGKYDVLISGGGQATRLLQDVAAVGGEISRSTVYMSGSDVAWVLDTLRTAAAGDTLLALRNAATDKFKVQGDGEIVAGAAGATHTLTGTLTTSGALTVQAGGAAITGAVTGSTTITAGTGITSTTGNITAAAGDVDVRRLVANNGTALVAGDFALSAGWGTTASIAVTSTAKDQRGGFGVTCNGASIAANPDVTLTFKDSLFPEIPAVVIVKAEITPVAPTTAYWAILSTTTGSVTFLFVGTPVAGSTYSARYMVMG